jgi:uncharacterized protein YrzB (UPF0473 family)
MENNEYNIIITGENGEDIVCEILFTLDKNDTNYVVYFEADKKEDEELELYASKYEETNEGEGKLIPIETDDEWDMIEEMINTYDDVE